MNSNSESFVSDSERQNSERQKSRIKLIAIIAIVLLPVLLSYLMYYTGMGVPSSTVNKGVLVNPPVDLQSVILKDADGNAWNWPDPGPVFKLVQFVEGACDEACQRLLYTARQVQTRLGKNSHQAIQVLVHGGELTDEFTQLLRRDYPRLTLLSAESYRWRDALPEGDYADGGRLYLVDRRSHLVMYYDQGHQGGDVLQDLNHLIKTVQ